MDPKELESIVRSFRFWYHKIDLGSGVITPGLDFDNLWNMIRKTRKALDYSGKKVLDLASFDGMWAFEAEKLGAETVIATDCYYETFKNFLFCREILKSKVIPYYNISPYDLWNRLDVFLQESFCKDQPFQRLFDIVQHLGLLYHLRDPMLTLSQARSVLKTGGSLLIETAAIIDDDGCYMVFNGLPPEKQRIYPDNTTWWAPTIPCLKEMLRATLFEPNDETVEILDPKTTPELKKMFDRFMGKRNHRVSRVSLVAKAIAGKQLDGEYFRELARVYRNPGLITQHLAE